jgi:hypothetical protein
MSVCSDIEMAQGFYCESVLWQAVYIVENENLVIVCLVCHLNGAFH